MANYSSAASSATGDLRRRAVKSLTQAPTPTQDVRKLMGGGYGDPRSKAMRRLTQPVASSEDLSNLGGAMRTVSHSRTKPWQKPTPHQTAAGSGPDAVAMRGLMRQLFPEQQGQSGLMKTLPHYPDQSNQQGPLMSDLLYRVGPDGPGRAAIKRLSGQLPPTSPADFGAGPSEMRQHQQAVDSGRVAKGFLVTPPGLVPGARPAQPQMAQAPTEQALNQLMGRYEAEARANLPTGLTPDGFSQRDVNSGSPILVRQDGTRFNNPRGYGGWNPGGVDEPEQRQVTPELANAVKERLGINDQIRKAAGISQGMPIDFQSPEMLQMVGASRDKNARFHALRKAALEKGLPVESIQDMTPEDQNALLAERRSGIYNARQDDLRSRTAARLARGERKGLAREQRLAQRAAGPDPMQMAISRLWQNNPEVAAEMAMSNRAMQYGAQESALDRAFKQKMQESGLTHSSSQAELDRALEKARNELLGGDLDLRRQQQMQSVEDARRQFEMGYGQDERQHAERMKQFDIQLEQARREAASQMPDREALFHQYIAQGYPEDEARRLANSGQSPSPNPLGNAANAAAGKPTHPPMPYQMRMELSQASPGDRVDLLVGKYGIQDRDQQRQYLRELEPDAWAVSEVDPAGVGPGQMAASTLLPFLYYGNEFRKGNFAPMHPLHKGGVDLVAEECCLVGQECHGGLSSRLVLRWFCQTYSAGGVFGC